MATPFVRFLFSDADICRVKYGLEQVAGLITRLRLRPPASLRTNAQRVECPKKSFNYPEPENSIRVCFLNNGH